MEPVEDSQDSFTLNLSTEWSIGSAPNGGYLIAILLTAADKALANISGKETAEKLYPNPISASFQYLGVCATPGEIEVRIHVLKMGKSFANLQGKIYQNGQLKTVMFCIYGNLSSHEEDYEQDSDENKSNAVGVLPVKPVGDIKKMELADFGSPFRSFHSLYKHIDAHVTLAAGDGSVSAIIGFRDNRPADMRMAALVADTLPPKASYMQTILNGAAAKKWFPTLHLDIQFLHNPNEGDTELRVESLNTLSGSRVFEVETEVYDSKGRIVLRVRQRAMEVDFAKNLAKAKKSKEAISASNANSKM